MTNNENKKDEPISDFGNENNLKLIIVGSGTDLESLKNYVRINKIKRIKKYT